MQFNNQFYFATTGYNTESEKHLLISWNLLHTLCSLKIEKAQITTNIWIKKTLCNKLKKAVFLLFFEPTFSQNYLLHHRKLPSLKNTSFKTFLKNHIELLVPIISQLMIKSKRKNIAKFKNHLFSIHERLSYVLAEI